MISILYISTSTIPSTLVERTITDIVETSRLRNEVHGVSGCLIFSGERFAQIFEGPESTVEKLMQNISGDTRHRDVTVLEQRVVADRRFEGWALGYAGQSRFIEHLMAKQVRSARNISAELIGVMTAFRDSSV